MEAVDNSSGGSNPALALEIATKHKSEWNGRISEVEPRSCPKGIELKKHLSIAYVIVN